jgi:hypothetical protein
MNASTTYARRVATFLISVALLAVSAPTLLNARTATPIACQSGHCGG